MKRCFILLAVVFASCGNESHSVSGQDSMVTVSAETTSAVEETWVYFSEYTFVNSSFRDGMKTPNMKRKLTEAEIKLLDSTVAGHFNPPPDTSGLPKLGCFRPKHAVERRIGNSSIVASICFECNNTRTTDPGFSKVPMEAWEYFFKRINIPVNGGYAEYFSKARGDSAFRSKNGMFQF